MKKKILNVFILFLAVLCLTACGKDSNGEKN